MTDEERRKGGEGFELESLRDDIEERLKKPPPSAVPPPPPVPEEAVEPPRHPDDVDVDTRTVAERLGTDVELYAGQRPPPDDWPLEALSFPTRGDTVGAGVAVLVWVLLDFVAWWNLLLGAVLKVFAYVFFLRWQLSVANATAAGKDEPTPFAKVADIDMDGVKGIARLMGMIVALLAPGTVVLLLGSTAAGVLLLLAGLAWAGVAALGCVVGEPSLVLPWKALPWMGARPLALLAGTLGWVAAYGIESLELGLQGIGVFAAIALAVPLRVAFVYLWLLSARALGVLGRAWSPYAE